MEENIAAALGLLRLCLGNGGAARREAEGLRVVVLLVGRGLFRLGAAAAGHRSRGAR